MQRQPWGLGESVLQSAAASRGGVTKAPRDGRRGPAGTGSLSFPLSHTSARTATIYLGRRHAGGKGRWSAHLHLPLFSLQDIDKFGNEITQLARPLPVEYLIIDVSVSRAPGAPCSQGCRGRAAGTGQGQGGAPILRAFSLFFPLKNKYVNFSQTEVQKGSPTGPCLVGAGAALVIAAATAGPPGPALMALSGRQWGFLGGAPGAERAPAPVHLPRVSALLWPQALVIDEATDQGSDLPDDSPTVSSRRCSACWDLWGCAGLGTAVRQAWHWRAGPGAEPVGAASSDSCQERSDCSACRHPVSDHLGVMQRQTDCWGTHSGESARCEAAKITPEATCLP